MALNLACAFCCVAGADFSAVFRVCAARMVEQIRNVINRTVGRFIFSPPTLQVASLAFNIQTSVAGDLNGLEEHRSITGCRLSPQNENVRFVQSRNVRFHGWPRGRWKRSESR